MNRVLLGYTAIFALILSSCSVGLVNEMRGGHSPMLQLDGEWGIVKNVAITPSEEVEVDHAEEVDFDATTDVGGFCAGHWNEVSNPNLTKDFWWSFDEEGEIFTLKLDGRDVEWTVIEQTKTKFVIERQDNGTVYKMEFAK